MEKNPIERTVLSGRIQASLVIPHFYGDRNDNFTALLEDIKKQTFRDLEILIVNGISPQGKAINKAVRIAQGEILIIMDDDSRIGHTKVFENLVQTLRNDSSIGMAGASVIIPDKANWFQRSASKQFPRYDMAVVKEVTESDLPGHPCAAFPKHVFEKIGMEREDILRGLDPDLRERVRKAGYRVVLVPETWITHPLPESIFKFIRVFLRNGYGSAYTQMIHPELNYDTDENVGSKTFVAKRPFIYRLLRYPVRLLTSLLSFQWIRFLGYFVYVLGYAAGLFNFAILRRREL